eukprot:1309894-Amphidinium_carterae.1
MGTGTRPTLLSECRIGPDTGPEKNNSPAMAHQPDDSPDWWPQVNLAGVQITVEQARATGHKLWESYNSKRNYALYADDTPTDFQPWCGMRILVAFFAMETAAWSTGFPRIDCVDWRAIALGCLGDRHPR